MNFGTLENWIEGSLSILDSETDPFVLNYEINSENGSNVDFRFVVTSQLLLKQAVENLKKLHCDATHKLMWQGLPVLLVGVSDLYHLHFE